MTPIFLLLSILLSTPTTTTADIVLDNIYNPVVAGSYYYCVSLVFNEMGPNLSGGPTLFNSGIPGCPSFIVARSNLSALDLGIPIKIRPEISRGQNKVYTNTNLNIAFEFLRPEPLCDRRYTTVWTVSGTENGNMVVVDGEEGSDASWFTLEKVKYWAAPVYSILYGGKALLYERQPNGEILLGLEKGYPFLVGFLKMSERSSTTLSDLLKIPRLSFAQGLYANK